MDSQEFCCEGNLFADFESLSLNVDITPRQHKPSDNFMRAWNYKNLYDYLDLYKPLMLLLPNNDNFKSLLSSLSTRLTNRSRIIQCPPNPFQPSSNVTTPFYSVAKPFVWYRNERAGSGSDERSGDELRDETKGDQVRDDIDEMEL